MEKKAQESGLFLRRVLVLTSQIVRLCGMECMNFLFLMSRTWILTIQGIKDILLSQAMQGCGTQFLPIKIGMEKMMNGFFIVEMFLRVVLRSEMYLSGRDSTDIYTIVV
jgi:hypothetical protein